MSLLLIHNEDIGGNREKTESVSYLLLLWEAIISFIVDLEVFVLSHHRGIDHLYWLEKSSWVLCLFLSLGLETYHRFIAGEEIFSFSIFSEVHHLDRLSLPFKLAPIFNQTPYVSQHKTILYLVK